jgi:hypothetical protein
MNENPYAAPAEVSSGTEPMKRHRTPGYLVAFGAISLMAEAIAAWFELPWDLVIGGLVVVGLVGLMMRGVFSAPVKPYTDDEPGDRPSEPAKPARAIPTGSFNALFVGALFVLPILLGAWHVAMSDDSVERFYRGTVLGLAAVGGVAGLAWDRSWRGLVAGGGIAIAAAEIFFRLVALYARAYGG